MALKNAGKTAALSQEYVVDSSDDEGSSPETPTRVSAEARSNGIRGTKEPAQDQELADSEDTDSDSGTASARQIRVKPLTKLSFSRKRNSDSKAVSQPEPKRARPPKISAPVNVRPRNFKPPSNFEKVGSPATADGIPHPLLSTQVENKQIWYFTAPRVLDLQSLQEIDIEAAFKGIPIIRQNGVAYSLSLDESSRTSLLLPELEGNYKHSKTSVSLVFHLQAQGQSAHATANSSHSEGPRFTALESGLPSEPRQQPTGLRMRNHPFGPAAASKASMLSKSPKKSSSKRSTSGSASSSNASGPNKALISHEEEQVPTKASIRKHLTQPVEAVSIPVQSSMVPEMDASPLSQLVTGSERKRKKKRRSQLMDEF